MGNTRRWRRIRQRPCQRDWKSTAPSNPSWQWIKHPGGNLDDGRKVTAELFRAITREELDKLEAQIDEKTFAGKYGRAAHLIDQITIAPDFETFITLPAYQEIH
jgi:malate synthase